MPQNGLYSVLLLTFASFLACSFALPPTQLQNVQSIIRSRTSRPIQWTRLYSGSIVDAYTFHWEALLSEEYQQAVSDLQQKRKTYSKRRLQDMGLTMWNLDAEPESELYGEKLVRVMMAGDAVAATMTDGAFVAPHYSRTRRNFRDLFARGEILLLTPIGRRAAAAAATKQQNLSSLPKECCIVHVGSDWMTLAVGPAWPVGLYEARRTPGAYKVRLDRTAPRASWDAQREALHLVRRGEAGEAARLLVDTTFFAKDNNHTAETTTAEAVLQHTTSAIPSRFQQQWSPTELKQRIFWALGNATSSCSFQPNQSQQDAIVWALGRKISLLQGPPGTGKTRVAALLIATALQLLPNHPVLDDDDVAPAAPPRVLAVAHSNAAADVLLEALLCLGVPAVRAGRPASVSEAVRHRTVLAMANSHPEVKQQQLRQRQDQNRKGHHAMRSNVIAKVCDSIIKTAPVVVASCIGAHQLLQSKCHFPLVVVDEAAQTTEPAVVCSLAASKAEQLVLIGDTRQLPPTIASECPQLRTKLGLSPMARLEAMGVEQRTLSVQYRMPPALLQHPARYFYNGRVTCADTTTSSYTAPPSGFAWPVPHMPLAFVPCGTDLEVTHEFGGKSNPEEAKIVVKIIQDMLQAADVSAQSIAVISPYSKQVQRIRSDLAVRNIRNVRVGTVDSFQGQETDVVIFSAVRSNAEADIGFLRDQRRLCVAITRARRGLILIGDQRVLRTCRHWAALLDSCLERGCMVQCDDSVVRESEVPVMCDQRQRVNHDSVVHQTSATVDWLDVLF